VPPDPTCPLCRWPFDGRLARLVDRIVEARNSRTKFAVSFDDYDHVRSAAEAALVGEALGDDVALCTRFGGWDVDALLHEPALDLAVDIGPWRHAVERVVKYKVALAHGHVRSLLVHVQRWVWEDRRSGEARGGGGFVTSGRREEGIVTSGRCLNGGGRCVLRCRRRYETRVDGEGREGEEGEEVRDEEGEEDRRERRSSSELGNSDDGCLYHHPAPPDPRCEYADDVHQLVAIAARHLDRLERVHIWSDTAGTCVCVRGKYVHLSQDVLRIFFDEEDEGIRGSGSGRRSSSSSGSGRGGGGGGEPREGSERRRQDDCPPDRRSSLTSSSDRRSSLPSSSDRRSSLPSSSDRRSSLPSSCSDDWSWSTNLVVDFVPLMRSLVGAGALRELKLRIPLTEELASIVRQMTHVPVLEVG